MSADLNEAIAYLREVHKGTVRAERLETIVSVIEGGEWEYRSWHPRVDGGPENERRFVGPWKAGGPQ